MNNYQNCLAYITVFLVVLLATIGNAQEVRFVRQGVAVRVGCRPRTSLPNIPTVYQWYDKNGAILTKNRDLYIPSFSAANVGRYTCKVTQVVQNKIISNEQYVDLRLDPQSGGNSGGSFVVTSPSNLDLYPGQMMYFKCGVGNQADSDYIYEWISPTGEKTPGKNFFKTSAQPSYSGVYTCRVTRRSDRSVSESRTRINIRNLNIQVSSSGRTVAGSVVNLKCGLDESYRPTTQLTYEWIAPSGNTISNTDSAVVVLDSSRKFGRYICRVTIPSLSPVYRQETYLNVGDSSSGGGESRTYTASFETIPPIYQFKQSLQIICRVSPELPGVTYQIFHNNIPISNGPTYVIPSLEVNNAGSYICQVNGNNPRTGQPMKLKSTLDIVIKKESSNQIELTTPPGPLLIARVGQRRELHCEVESGTEGREVQWFFDGRPITGELSVQRRLKISPRYSVSILVLDSVNTDNVGTYVCEVKGIRKEARLAIKASDREIKVRPKILTRKANEINPAEYHCYVRGYSSLNRDLVWEFRSSRTGSTQPLDMRKWERNDDPATDHSSFILIRRPTIEDDGTYICREPRTGDTASSVLKVTDSVQIFVSPRTQTNRMGQTATVQCYVTNAGNNPVYPTMYFEDGREVTSDRSVTVNRLDNNRIQVQINNINKNMKLMCRHGSKTATATIIVKRVCSSGYRLCRNGQCINSAKFCDGRRDCNDGSDEDQSYCRICDPLTKKCEIYAGRSALVANYQINWQCDGEDDCGNGYDESNCNDHRRTCDGMTYKCQSSGKYIARSYRCDGEVDCAGGDDETNCNIPTIIPQSSSDYQNNVRRGTTVTLVCKAVGSPLPRIIWRFNWGCLPNVGFRMTVSERYSSDCSQTISTLTITGFQPGDDGIYNCEALSAGKRAWSQDYRLMVNFRT